MLIALLIVLNVLQNGHFQPILAAIFVTIATVKIESIPDFYTCNKLIRRNISKAIFIFWPHRGAKIAS